MKKLYFLAITFLISSIGFAQLSINEVNYYANPVVPWVEIVGPVDYDTTGWEIVHYYDIGGPVEFQSFPISGLMPSEEVFSVNGLSLKVFIIGNVSILSPSYFELRNTNTDTTVQVVGYAGATPGVIIDGVTSVDIGSAVDGNSLQFNGFGWIEATPTPNAPNPGQDSTLPVAKNEIEGFAMYPNPVSNGQFYISTPNTVVQKQVEIYSVIGEQVYSKQVKSNETVDISNLTSGFYMVRIEEEGKIATRKLIVK